MQNADCQYGEAVIKAIDSLHGDMEAIAHVIHSEPEIGHQEFAASETLSGFLEKRGFEVERGIAGMKTAFSASFSDSNTGPVIAILAEYDALPELGHACGHNLIGTAATGAAIGVSQLLSGVKGTVKVLGCPAEEAGVDNAGGKAILVEQNVFGDIDAALLFHPMPATMVGGETTALVGLEFKFRGRAAHAAGNPWDGINALDGVLQTYNSINALRQHIRDGVRIHGVITRGGAAPNIVPDEAAARFFLRAVTNDELTELVEKVSNCARGAAIATGTKLEVVEFNNRYDSSKSNQVLANIFTENLKKLGLEVEGKKRGKGSSDFGNVSQVVPACEVDIRLGDGIVPHTKRFLQASNAPEGYGVMMLGAKVLAITTLDLLHSSELLQNAKDEFTG